MQKTPSLPGERHGHSAAYGVFGRAHSSSSSSKHNNEEFGKESALQIDVVAIVDSLHGTSYDPQQEKNLWFRKVVLEPPPIPEVEAHEHL